MRVMLVTNGLGYGGAERIVEALAHAVTAAGHAVHVVATTRGGPIRDALREAKVPVSVLSIKSRVDVRAPAKLVAVARKFAPDVLHSHLAVADITTALANVVLKKRIVTTIHNPGVEIDPFKRTLWRAALPRFDRVTAVSEAVRRSVDGVNVEVIRPSLVDLDEPRLSRDDARRQLGLPTEEKIVLGVGRLARIKGFDVLAAAAPMVEGAIVAVIGDGPERNALEGTSLRLLGAHADAARLLAAADVVVQPSRSEGFPQVPLQAMAASVPVVATRVGGTPEVVEDGETGRLVPPDDPSALAAALNETLANPGPMGAAGRRRLLERGLTRAAMFERTLDLYASLA